MSSSSGIGSSSRGQSPPPPCKCGEDAVLRKSSKPWSFGRRFYGCPYYDPEAKGKVRRRWCDFFRWYDRDPESTDDEAIINALAVFERKCEKIVKKAVSDIVISAIVAVSVSIVVVVAIVKAAGL